MLSEVLRCWGKTSEIIERLRGYASFDYPPHGPWCRPPHHASHCACLHTAGIGFDVQEGGTVQHVDSLDMEYVILP